MEERASGTFNALSQNQTQGLINILARLLKAIYAKPAETAVTRERLCRHARC
jgi:hypothetical protein